jgi:hypothetical protein
MLSENFVLFYSDKLFNGIVSWVPANFDEISISEYRFLFSMMPIWFTEVPFLADNTVVRF